MPLFHTRCKACGLAGRCILTTPEELEQRACKACQGGLERVAGATTMDARKVERLDNGTMARAVERLDDAERLYAERARNADPLAGGRQLAAGLIPKLGGKRG